MIKTIAQFAESFYKANLETLTRNYPGLREPRLARTLCDYLGKGPEEAMLLDERDPLFSRLLQGEPLEYILGEAHFFTSRFFVNSNVLIPRNETEILVEDALGLIKNRGYKSFADIGTGSGCVALSILCEADRPLSALATDISEKALEVCAVNAFRHQCRFPQGSEFQMKLGDRFQPLEEKVDLIVSNPPYIDWQEDRQHVHFQTDQYEPKLALYLEHESYEQWFEKFFKDASERLNQGGALLMEGHESKLQELKTLSLKYFGNAEVKMDYTRADRFLRAFKED